MFAITFQQINVSVGDSSSSAPHAIATLCSDYTRETRFLLPVTLTHVTTNPPPPVYGGTKSSAQRAGYAAAVDTKTA